MSEEVKVKKTTPKKETVSKKETVKKVSPKKEAVEEKVEIQVLDNSKLLNQLLGNPDVLAQLQAMLVPKVETVVNVKSNTKVGKLSTSEIRMKYKDTPIRVVNKTNGSLSYRSPKNGTLYNFANYNDEDCLTIDEILAIPKTYLDSLWMFIDNEEIAELKGLTKLYKYMELLDDVDEIVNVDLDELEEACNVIIKQTRNFDFINNVSSKVQEQIDNGSLDSNRIVKELKRILRKDFHLK